MMTEHQENTVESDAEPDVQQSKGYLRRNAFVLVIAGLLVFVAASAGLTWVSQSAALADQEARLAEIQVQLDTEQRKINEQLDADMVESLGISRGRLIKDQRTIEGLVETAFTWDSGPAYEQARTQLKQRYGLSEDEEFLTKFMPPSRYNEDADGKRYYYIDSVGLNSAVGNDLDIEVVSVRADEYTYVVIVTLDVTSDAVDRGDTDPASVTAHRTMLLYVTIDVQGDVSDLSGIPASGSTRESN